MNNISDVIENLINSLKTKELDQFVTIYDLYKKEFPDQVAYSEVYSLKNGILTIKVDNGAAINLLQFKKEQIKSTINRELNNTIIEEIKFSLKRN